MPKSYPSQRVVKIGTENRLEEILGDIVVAHLQVALDGLGQTIITLERE